MKIDADQIIGGLYQGGAPPTGKFVRHAGFDVLVLCALEYQPDSFQFPGVVVLRIPFDDVPVRLTAAEAAPIRAMGKEVARQLKAGRRVLVTCQAGLNRSGIVVASALLQGTKMTPLEAVACIRSRRDSMALCNSAFVHAIMTGKVGGRGLEKVAAIR